MTSVSSRKRHERHTWHPCTTKSRTFSTSQMVRGPEAAWAKGSRIKKMYSALHSSRSRLVDSLPHPADVGKQAWPPTAWVRKQQQLAPLLAPPVCSALGNRYNICHEVACIYQSYPHLVQGGDGGGVGSRHPPTHPPVANTGNVTWRPRYVVTRAAAHGCAGS